MREKDFSFKWMEGNKWTHSCNPNKPFIMPSTMNESYGIESTKSGFEGEETLPASKQDKDKDKVNKIVNDKELPEEAEKGKAYIVHWADGRAIFACKYKSYLPKWLEKTGNWADIISIKYDTPKDLKIINKKGLDENLRLILNKIYFKG